MCTTDPNFHDKIAELCINHFCSLPKTGKPKQNEWTVLSCIVIEDRTKFEVVALGTGSKCIGHDKMSEVGDILNDSHGEVMCRRSFLRYIYEIILSEKDDKIQFNKTTKKFDVRSDLKFHFFTTHVPCGDAAIFPKQSTDDFGNLLLNYKENSLKRTNESNIEINSKRMKSEGSSFDIFRTGAKCLESDTRKDLLLQGADYHVTGVVRTKPGRGVPTLSVSCSDKLSKWCHLGVQGALLSILLNKPIYLDSFTIAGETPFNEKALQRALFERLENVYLEPPFHKAEIIIGQATVKFSYGKSDEKSPSPCSIAWVKSANKQLEVAVDGRRQGITKKQIKTKIGRLRICKMELFQYFIQVIKKFEIILEKENNLNELNYKRAKLFSVKYQECWNMLKNSFQIWTKKDDKLSLFCSDCS